MALKIGYFVQRLADGMLVSIESAMDPSIQETSGTVFLGTFYPLFVELIGPDKISVGPPYFNRTFVPLVIPLLLAMVIGPYLRWKRDELWSTLARAKRPAALAVVFVALIVDFGGFSAVAPALGLGVGAWVVFGALAIFAQRIRLFSAPFARSLNLARTTPRATACNALCCHLCAETASEVMTHTCAQQFPCHIRNISQWSATKLGSVDIHLDAMRAATRFQFAA